MKRAARLIVYVGPSKTGSTSLAATLRRNGAVLESGGARYWGSTLDLAPLLLYGWQSHRPPEQLLQATAEDDSFPSQFVDAVEQGLKVGMETGIRDAIIVNDAWVGRWHERAIEVLQAVAELPVEVFVVAYVRSPSAYAQSAYAHWELKQKAHSGPIRPYADYLSRRDFHFAPAMEAFDRVFGDRFLLRNYERVDDVVQDFLDAVGLGETPLPAVYANARPSTEEELIRAFYNARHEAARPQEFQRFAAIDFDHDVVEWYRSLLPTRRDIRRSAREMRDDLRRMNALLRARGQPPVRDRKHLTLRSVKRSLISVLLQIVYDQHLRIAVLEDSIRDQ